ncbi:glycosyltransferase family 4 protein [Bradyrhizobium sp. McL0616]|uniref:glycosyltransferase family 4 protein n=1 Tax=Bradyrhizobium sp. McL0616 TaxID=3415674 RepID=UPI003CE86197
MTGVETFILQLCAAQKRAGHEPSIAIDLVSREEVRAIAQRGGIATYDLADPPILDATSEATQRTVRTKRAARRLAKLWLRVQRVWSLRRLLREADVIHIHAVGISGIDGFLARALSPGKALIVTHHATFTWFARYRSRVSDLTFWLEKWLSNRVVMPYAAALAEFVANGIPKSRAIVIPFCVDQELFWGQASTPDAGTLTIVMSARMFAGKGHLELLSAIAALMPRYPGLRAVLIGDGPNRPEVEALIERLGLREVVECMGRVDHSDVPAIMRRGHVIALPSYMEGEMFPLCLMEGMALGLPAIATRLAGIPEIIADGETGILVEPCNEAALVRAIEVFLSDRAFYARAAVNAMARFQSRFSAASVAQAYLEQYEDALRQLTGRAFLM